MAYCCSQNVIRIRQGDDSNFNGETIKFQLDSLIDFTNWSAGFQLQEKYYTLTIINHTAELILSAADTLKLESGFCYGYLQLTDPNGRKQTVYAQKFMIEPRRVFSAST